MVRVLHDRARFRHDERVVAWRVVGRLVALVLVGAIGLAVCDDGGGDAVAERGRAVAFRRVEIRPQA